MKTQEIDRSIDTGLRHWAHLVKRFLGSLSSKEPSAIDQAWATSWLNPGEAQLWLSTSVEDRRHTIRVARAYNRVNTQATRAEMAAALLHDVGKVRSGLTTLGRVAAKLVGPRTERFKVYHDHEDIGADMLRAVHSDPLTIAMIDGSCEQLDLLAKLLAADNA